MCIFHKQFWPNGSRYKKKAQQRCCCTARDSLKSLPPREGRRKFVVHGGVPVVQIAQPLREGVEDAAKAQAARLAGLAEKGRSYHVLRPGGEVPGSALTPTLSQGEGEQDILTLTLS